MQLPIEPIAPEGFEPFGWVISHDPDGERFQVITADPDATGWQIACNRIANRGVDQLARHPNTLESFEPLTGVAVLVLAPAGAPDNLRAFLLDRPVCIRKNIWHATLTLSEVATVKISENVHVDAEFHPLGQTLEAKLA
jgi:ureidoglycolate hydrolase